MIMGIKRLNIFRSGRIHPQFFPLLVWLAALSAVVMLFYHGAQRFEVLGIAQSEIAQVCAPVDGRLKAVYVHLFDDVTKGQVVASLDDELLSAKIATVAAAADHLRAQLVPAQERLLADIAASELNQAEEERRFAVDVERARLDILGLKAQIAADQITLENLAAEVKISIDLLSKKAIAPYEMEKTQSLYDATAKKVLETEKQLSQAEVQLKETQQRQDTFAVQNPQHPSVDAALEAIRKEAAIQEKLMEELMVQRKELVITAPIEGTVIQIMARANEAVLHRAGEGVLRKAGEAVLAGQPILTIAQGKPKEIIGYASERQLGQIRPGVMVELVKNTNPAQIAKSEVTYVGPVIEQLPARLWQNPNVPQWGLPFLVKVPEGMVLTAGEVIGIRRL
jgi:multidrug efflux pump subunit AcrA (membrane-fusion protein)